MTISPVHLSTHSPVAPQESLTSADQSSEIPFSTTLQNVVREAEMQQQQLSVGMNELSIHQTGNLQQLAVDAAKAELSLRFVMEMRDRLIASYQEIMRMQI